jgi:hypothetical protein
MFILQLRLRHINALGEAVNLVRLACVRHAASVRPEPGSNSRLIFLLKITLGYLCLSLLCYFVVLILELSKVSYAVLLSKFSAVFLGQLS